MKKLIPIWLVTALFGGGYVWSADTWTTLDYPGASWTRIYSIDGCNLAGHYYDGSRVHGFLYDGTDWTALDAPGSYETQILSIDGDNMIGNYNDDTGDHSFLYNRTTSVWSPLDMPGAISTDAYGIDGSQIVGRYYDESGTENGFVYDGITWSTFSMPEETMTGYLVGISGGNLIGRYHTEYGNYSFFYDGISWITLVAFIPQGIDGSNTVGYLSEGFVPQHNFYHYGTILAFLDKPGATATYFQDISGSQIVGWYEDVLGSHGFLYTISEPGTVLLLGLGGLIIKRRI